MAKIVQERTEQEFHNRINGVAQERAENMQTQLRGALAKAAEAAEKKRKAMIAREYGLSLLAVAGIAGLYMAQIAGLISSVLTYPVYAIAFVYIGWHLCKASTLRGRK